MADENTEVLPEEWDEGSLDSDEEVAVWRPYDEDADGPVEAFGSERADEHFSDDHSEEVSK